MGVGKDTFVFSRHCLTKAPNVRFSARPRLTATPRAQLCVACHCQLVYKSLMECSSPVHLVFSSESPIRQSGRGSTCCQLGTLIREYTELSTSWASVYSMRPDWGSGGKG